MGERSGNAAANGTGPAVRPASALVDMNEQVLALIAAIDELRAAQDALAGALMRGPAPANVDRVIADLLRDAQAAADSIRARGEQDAAAIRQLARTETEAFLTDLSHLSRQLDAVREQAGIPTPAESPPPAPAAPPASSPAPAPSSVPPRSAQLAPPAAPAASLAPTPAPDVQTAADAPESPPGEASADQEEREALLAALREEREGLRRELQRIQTFDPVAAGRASSDDSEGWLSRLFGRRR